MMAGGGIPRPAAHHREPLTRPPTQTQLYYVRHSALQSAIFLQGAGGLPIIQAPFGTGGSRITALAVRVGSGHKEPFFRPGQQVTQHYTHRPIFLRRLRTQSPYTNITQQYTLHGH